MMIFRSLARLMAFARRAFSIVRSMVVIAFSYGKLSDKFYYTLHVHELPQFMSMKIVYLAIKSPTISNGFGCVFFKRIHYIQHEMLLAPRHKIGFHLFNI